MTSRQDPRIRAILELLEQLTTSKTVQGVPPAVRVADEERREAREGRDDLDMILEHLHLLAARLRTTQEQLRAASEKVQRSEKLALMGQLCGGVAHELRNPLGALKNASYFLKMALEAPEPDVEETLNIIGKEVRSCERIIGNLLNFARPKTFTYVKVGINALVEECLKNVPVPEDVEVSKDLGEELPLILADPDQLGQALGNIILNACQAMAAEGGRLNVRTEPTSTGGVIITFSDTGEGIHEDHLPQIFEPLFTTKAKGIGLGLAVTSTLIEEQRGFISVESRPGEGATFKIELPVDARGGGAND